MYILLAGIHICRLSLALPFAKLFSFTRLSSLYSSFLTWRRYLIMQLLTITTILGLLTLPFCVEAKLINVDVGNGGIIFEPSTVVADIGDQVQFRFYNVG